MTDQKPVRVGFVGAGWSERVQIPIFRLAGLIPQAICASRPENSRRAAEAAGVPEAYATWQELVAAPSVDLVSVVTPPHLHREIAAAALAAGKHVICEKPTALNVAEAEAMLAAAQAAPNQLAIIDHELRYHPQFVVLRQMVKDGLIGSILRLDIAAHRNSRLDPEIPWNWLSDAQQGGGMLGALGSHLFDLTRWIAGKIDSLTAMLQTGHYYRTDPATGQRREVTADDHVQILLRFANGAQGSITVSGLTPGPAQNQLTVLGTRGALRLDSQWQLWSIQGERLGENRWQRVETGFPAMVPSTIEGSQPFHVGTYFLGRALAETLDAGETVMPEAASFYDGLAVQRALDAARQSQQEQRWVTV
ncbi:MAG TPA: Gfo/Idh/MocA family oxidoreductase [Caldilineaceae bacterium]|nr:Gfo/Idh/MocA family oxidoreductase [Caldilineaceae bacterium]